MHPKECLGGGVNYSIFCSFAISPMDIRIERDGVPFFFFYLGEGETFSLVYVVGFYP